MAIQRTYTTSTRDMVSWVIDDCKICGREFKSKNTRRKTCGKACSKKNILELQKAYRKRLRGQK